MYFSFNRQVSLVAGPVIKLSSLSGVVDFTRAYRFKMLVVISKRPRHHGGVIGPQITPGDVEGPAAKTYGVVKDSHAQIMLQVKSM